MALAPGYTVTHGNETYLIGDILNEGGFGVAYLAEKQSAFRQRVVVKTPNAAAAADPLWSLKFRREARILANISHRNVVKILAVWDFDTGETAIVQEYVRDAKDLTTYVNEFPNSATSLLLQVLYALRALHSACSPAIVHRDLSPNNILVDGDGVVKVIDFGLAKEDPRGTGALTVTGDWFGTPGCMAPEQMKDVASVDHRADLYTLGRSFAAALQNRMPPHADVHALSEPWRSLCLKLTAFDRTDRHQSPQDALGHALDLFASSGILLDNIDVHVREMKDEPVTASWAKLCERHFLALPDLETDDIQTASKLPTEVFAQGFDPLTFFDRLEASVGIAEYESGGLAFSAADHLAELYEKLFEHLDAPRRHRCFRRLCRTAIRYHRYSVMGAVRETYSQEQGASHRLSMLAILNEEDPERIIEGRGSIPR